MAEDTNTKYFLSLFKDGKVTELHVLESEDQVKVFAAIGRAKGCDSEVHRIDLPCTSSPDGHDIGIKNISSLSNQKKMGWCKCVKCVETGEIFPSIRECSRKYEINYRSLYNAIKSGNPRKLLHFKPFNGEIPENVKVQRSDFFKRGKRSVYGKMVLCVTTGRMFKSVKDMLKAYPQVSCTSFYRNMEEGKPVEGLVFQYI